VKKKDGTINYLTLPAITDGLRFLSAYLPFLPLRLSSLLHFLTSSLSRLRYERSEDPVVRILSRLPTKRLKSVGEQADTGSTISLLFLSVSPFFNRLSLIIVALKPQPISLLEKFCPIHLLSTQPRHKISQSALGICATPAELQLYSVFKTA